MAGQPVYNPPKEEWKSSPYWDAFRYQSTDYKFGDKGVRIKPRDSHDDPLTLSHINDLYKERGYFINTPKPIPSNILFLFQLFESELSMNNSYEAKPFFTWSQYKMMYDFFSAHIPMDHGEDYWITVRSQIVPIQLEPYLLLVDSLYNLYGIYYNLAILRWKKTLNQVFTQEEWNLQQEVKVLRSISDYEEEIRRVIASFKPPPYYTIPTEGEFRTMVRNYYAERPVIAFYGSFVMQAQPGPWLILRFYTKTYPNFDAQLNTPFRAVANLIQNAFCKQWEALIGDQNMRRENYVMLRDKWGTPKPNIVLTSVSLSVTPQPRQINFYCPLESELETLKRVHSSFLGGAGTFEFKDLSLCMSFLTRQKTLPTPTGLTADLLLSKLSNPLLQADFLVYLQQILSFILGYTLVLADLSHDFALPFGSWGWDPNEVGPPEGKDAVLLTPEQVKERLDKYPHIASLSEDAFRKFLHECYPIPPLRKPLDGETDDYRQKCLASTTGYMNWFNSMIKHRKVLETEGLRIGEMVKQVMGKEVYNMYPDFGVWAFPEQRTGWQQFVNVITNPYKNLYGESLYQALLKQWKDVYDVLLDCLVRAGDAAGDWMTKYGTYVLAGGVIAVVGINQVGRIINK